MRLVRNCYLAYFCRLKEELNQNISTIEKRQADYNALELQMINKVDSMQQSIDGHVKERRVADKSLLDMSVQNQKLTQQNEDLVNEVIHFTKSGLLPSADQFSTSFSFVQIVHLKEEIGRFKTQISTLESSNSLISDMHGDVEHVRLQLEKLLVNLTVLRREVFVFLNKIFCF